MSLLHRPERFIYTTAAIVGGTVVLAALMMRRHRRKKEERARRRSIVITEIQSTHSVRGDPRVLFASRSNNRADRPNNGNDDVNNELR
eukprot:CAMPEP_0113529286 /NCGR_PEP_ID=MMETSP0015_2-20120614/2311_1 /TAXON_ID=2838 /ORGANISM="Odontella" /LENGTH=87 /DNA_ID=CAMNT_0000427903 /DNA_START=62 /DNA_END=322 /DNA_ORIENTATION=+ /assembly_acc=CAM_ASM_000160